MRSTVDAGDVKFDFGAGPTMGRSSNGSPIPRKKLTLEDLSTASGIREKTLKRIIIASGVRPVGTVDGKEVYFVEEVYRAAIERKTYPIIRGIG